MFMILVEAIGCVISPPISKTNIQTHYCTTCVQFYFHNNKTIFWSHEDVLMWGKRDSVIQLTENVKMTALILSSLVSNRRNRLHGVFDLSCLCCWFYRQSFHPSGWNHSPFPFGLCSSPFTSATLFGPGHFGESYLSFVAWIILFALVLIAAPCRNCHFVRFGAPPQFLSAAPLFWLQIPWSKHGY